ncbi:multicopper oxidase domain-containing protein [Kocuria marina]|uniref:multicopper oxidase domain-containing protein n=1 Tax=Kocuria marina TaxID=223184 RepID=UPI0034616FF8
MTPHRFRSYDVVAMSFPIVYSLEGDHDPNGLLYTLRTYVPLLKWVKHQRERNGRYLTTLHRRTQLMETVVYGLPRYLRMRGKLSEGPQQNHYLLSEFGDEAEVLEREKRDAHSPRRSPRDRAIRQNYRATVDQVVSALTELTGGKIRSLKPRELSGDHGYGQKSSENNRFEKDLEERLQGWVASWTAQLDEAEAALERQLTEINRTWPELLDIYRTQCPGSQLSDRDIQRLMFNDHTPLKDYTSHSPGQGVEAPAYNRCNPLKPIPLVRPLVLRARRGEWLKVHFENEIRGREVGLHAQGDGLGGTVPGRGTGSGVRYGDGACVGDNDSTALPYGHTMTYRWRCEHEGVWPINDMGDIRGTDRGTNNHGLFAALVVEPEGARWYDPVTGHRLDGTDHADGLYVDVVPRSEQGLKDGTVTVSKDCPDPEHHTCPKNNRCRSWREEHFVDFHHAAEDPERFAGDCSFREFTVFFHDEPETTSGIPHPLPHSAMPLSYRAEPMHNRLPYRLYRRMRLGAQGREPGRKPDAQGIDHSAVLIEMDDLLGEEFWVAEDTNAQDKHGKDRFLERVSGEEQHHSSWLFGDPVTPILRAYRGDPSRVRIVHAGVKETHVYHLHVHQWRAVAQDTADPSVWQPDRAHGSQLLDSASIGPQTAMTIDPLYGSGSRQHAMGDIIWHCHLYPHFHHGMWGLWRSYDRLVDGTRAYPDGTPCPALQPLPGRMPPEPEDHPGFPWFIDGSYPRKSPPPPAPHEDDTAGKEILVDGRRQLLGMSRCSKQERAAFAGNCRSGKQPGALFVDLDGLARRWNEKAGVPERRIIHYDIAVADRGMVYNSAGWYDPHGHHYQLEGISITRLNDDGTPAEDPVRFDHPETDPAGGVDAFFPRANHGDIVELRLRNTLGTVKADHFDFPGHPVECGLHVHLVKFDVLAADGSCSGWNYLSGASSPEAVPKDTFTAPNVSLHRWVVDEEFGTCFFHDHLLANFRQKRGLFAALIAEPNGTRWLLPNQQTPAWAGSQAVVVPRGPDARGTSRDAGIVEPFREAGLALGDYVPLNRPGNDLPPQHFPLRDDYDYPPGDDPLNEPTLLGGDDDPGVMGVNYRCAPMRYRGKDPSEWFSSSRPALKPERFGPDPWPSAGDAEHPVLDAREGHLSPPLPVPAKHRGDPDTPVIHTYPGEHLRIRLFQGSHEEQHSFMLNGMRWRKDWHNPRSPLVNQQTLGISEAFTLDINPPETAADRTERQGSPYGVGDHLWQFTVMDDLWLGCWGLIRSHQPNAQNFRELPPLQHSTRAVTRMDREFGRAAGPTEEELTEDLKKFKDRQSKGFLPARPPHTADEPHPTVREYVVVAQRHEHPYAGHALTDPWGLIYRTAEEALPEITANGTATGNLRAAGVSTTDEPLVLRAHPGEWLKITLINEVLLPKQNIPGQDFATADPHLPDFGPEVSPPRLPVEHRDELGRPDRRTVSPRVSLHPSLLLYDVVSDDGSYTGLNHDSTVAALKPTEDDAAVHLGHDAVPDPVVQRADHGAGHRDPNWREYWWYADPALAEGSPGEDASHGRTCYLFDMGDIRNHRHHGLIGAVVIEPKDLTPVDPHDENREQWTGPHVHLRGRTRMEIACETEDGTTLCHPEEERTVAQEFVLFLQDGLRHFLHGDIDQPLPDISPSDPPVDVGQKAISYRSPLTPHPHPLRLPNATASVQEAEAQLPIWWRLVCAGDKPRNHTFTVHNFVWDLAPWIRQDKKAGPQAGAVTAISAGFAQDLVAKPDGYWDPGDHAYRSGSFRWAVAQGMWGILRIQDKEH